MHVFARCGSRGFRIARDDYAAPMTMRLDVTFAKPLSREQRTRFLLVVSALAKTKRIAFVRGDFAAVISGEALGAAAVRDALAEEGLIIESITSSLAEAVGAESAGAGAHRERVRPIGR